MDPSSGKLFPISQNLGTHSDNKLINYAVVDAFTDTSFKGNPAAVCLLPVKQETPWMQQVASEFNLPATAFVVRRVAASVDGQGILSHDIHFEGNKDSRLLPVDFDIRWFTSCSEVELCGHATLASAYVLFASGVVGGSIIQFHSQSSGILTAQKVEKLAEDQGHAVDEKFASKKFVVELNFPIISSTGCSSELEVLSITLKDTTPVSFRKTAKDLMVELSSGEEVEALQPCVDEIRKCTARGIMVTGHASSDSGYDFISRFFAPKVGLDEDPVCVMAHCALAAFWAKKLKKETLTAYQASKRGGVLHLRVDFEAGRTYLRGDAVICMSGVLLNTL